MVDKIIVKRQADLVFSLEGGEARSLAWI